MIVKLITICLICIHYADCQIWERIRPFISPRPSNSPLPLRVDCKFRWGPCKGSGLIAYRDPVILQDSKNGGKACPKRDYNYCRSTGTPVDCKFRWGNCQVRGSAINYRDPIILAGPKNGGKKCPQREYGCRAVVAPVPIDCEFTWGECIPARRTYRDPQIISKPKYGGKECPQRQWDCHHIVDCEFNWGRCIGQGSSGYQNPVITTYPSSNGKPCPITRRCYNNNNNIPGQKVDCVYTWGNCKGSGASSYKDPIITKQPQNGGKECPKRQKGCALENIKRPVVDRKTNDRLKTTSELFIKNFMSEVEGGTSSSSSSSSDNAGGARGINFFAVQTVGVAGSSRSFGPSSPMSNQGGTCTYHKENKKIFNCNKDEAIFGNVATDPDIMALANEIQSSRKRRSIPIYYKPKRDMLFLIDESLSVGEYKFLYEKEVVVAIVQLLCGNIKPGYSRTRIGVATFDAINHEYIKFGQYENSIYELVYRIRSIPFISSTGGRTCLANTIKRARTRYFTSSWGSRFGQPGVQADILLLTDGCANCESYRELQRQAYMLKLKGINVYVIGIGLDDNCIQKLRILARGGKCFHFFYFNDFDTDIRYFLYELRNPPSHYQCIDRFEFPGIKC